MKEFTKQWYQEQLGKLYYDLKKEIKNIDKIFKILSLASKIVPKKDNNKYQKILSEIRNQVELVEKAKNGEPITMNNNKYI